MPNFVLWLALVTLILASAIHGYPSEVTYEIVEEITSPPTETTHEVISSPTDITSPPADQVTSSPPTESCAQILEMGDPTKEQWKSTLGPWVAEKLQEYKQENEDDDTPGFFRWLTDSYTPGYSSCDDLQNCEPVDCGLMRGDIPVEEQWTAFYALSAIANFMRSEQVKTDASKTANQWVLSKQSSMELIFSDNDKISNHRAITQQAADAMDRSLAGNTLVESVASGEYAEPNLEEADFVQHYQDLWVASYVGVLWQRERTYIVEANAVNGCENDHRGPESLRVCLDQYPGKVFYPYFIPKTREGTCDQALIRGPPNWLQLSDYSTITLQDAVAASVAHRDSGEGGKYHGLFSLPICNNPGGEAISSVMSGKDRNYPCLCGDFPWEKAVYEKDETEQFLIDTGLYLSGDWNAMCDHAHHCHEDHDHEWTFPSKPHKHFNHPWKSCHNTTHEYKGYDAIGDDGYKAHEDED